MLIDIAEQDVELLLAFGEQFERVAGVDLDAVGDSGLLEVATRFVCILTAAIGVMHLAAGADPAEVDLEAVAGGRGEIGDRRGLPAVLSALEDKPAIRRRAAVALAAFDGPLVQAALQRCLDDRDWQVRQVAEDLLAVE